MKAAVLVLVLVSVSPPVFAEPATRLAYEAPDGCPNQKAFVDAVTSRGSEFDGGTPRGSARLIVVAIHKQKGAFAGAFQLRDNQIVTDKRQLRGSSCEEVADALAMVTAVALHSDDVVAEAPPSPIATPAPIPLPPPQPVRFRGSNLGYSAHHSVVVETGRLSLDMTRVVNVQAGFASGAAPSTIMPRFDLSLSGAGFLTTPDGAQRIFGVIPRLRVSYLGPATYRATDARTELSGGSGGVGLCSTPHYDSSGLVVLLCGEVGAGVMSSRTSATEGGPVISKNTGFGTVGFDMEIQYNVTSFLSVGAKLGGNFLWASPWTAERADGSRIFEASRWSGFALLGVGLRF